MEEMHKLLAMLPEAVRRRMVGMYVESLRSQILLLGHALHGGDHETASSLAHKMAGSAAMMQDSALSKPTREMEKSLRAGRPEEALRLWPLVQSNSSRTLEVLDRELTA